MKLNTKLLFTAALLISINTMGYALSTYAFDSINSNPPAINLIVAADNSGDCVTIGEALRKVPHPNKSIFVIFIKKGIYNEKISINEDNVLLVGEDRSETSIIYAEQKWIWQCRNNPEDTLPAVVNINGSGCTLINLTVRNNWGELHKNDPLPKLDCEIVNYEAKVKPNGHQYALLLSGDATKLIVLDCNIIADGADTFCPWNKTGGMYFIKGTYFEGWTDFVCPRGDCFITDSQFFCRGGVAALWHDGSASKEKKFVIKNSSFDGADSFKLGRYTHDAQFIIVNSVITARAADKNIYQAKPDAAWGHRVYFSGCKSEGKNFDWLKDNFSESGYLPPPEKINAVWTFGGKWDPEKEIAEKRLSEIPALL